jgi:hypothetical protein
MKPLIILNEDGVAYRMEPFALQNVSEIIERVSNQSFSTIKKHTTFEVAESVGSSGVQYKRVPFHLSITKKNEAVYWGYIPGIVFDTSFQIVEHSGTPRLIADFTRSATDAFQDRIYCSSESLSTSDCKVRFLVAISLTPGGSGNYEINAYFCFQLFDVKAGLIMGNFLPCIPNVFADARVCMGSAFDKYTNPVKTSDEEIQRTLKSFFESRMNSDLITQGANRIELADQLIGWNREKKQVAPIKSAKTILTVKVGNYYLDGLPYATVGW